MNSGKIVLLSGDEHSSFKEKSKLPISADGQEQESFGQIQLGKTDTGQARIESLTGLRWFAALAVLFSHNPPGGNTPEWIQNLFRNGYSGVTLFFVLSGFILTVNYKKSLGKPKVFTVGNFYIARFARIYPLYFLILIFVTAFQVQITDASLSGWWEHLLSIQAWTYGSVFSWNGPGWSIGVEIFFYALFPAIILVFNKSLDRIRGSISLMILAISYTSLIWLAVSYWGLDAHRFLYVFPISRLGDFVIGIGAAGLFLTLKSAKKNLEKPMAILAFGSIALILLIMTNSATGTNFQALSYDLLFQLPFVLLILGLSLSPNSIIARFLSHKWMLVLGEISYAFYLIHIPLGAAMFSHPLIDGFTFVSSTVFILGIFLLIATSWGLHILFEIPARLFIRKHVKFRSNFDKR